MIRMKVTLLLLIIDYSSFSFMFKHLLVVVKNLNFCIVNCSSEECDILGGWVLFCEDFVGGFSVLFDLDFLYQITLNMGLINFKPCHIFLFPAIFSGFLLALLSPRNP